MRSDTLHRYDRDSAGNILIDVAAEKTEDLYNDFDRSAPYIRRDLDEELVDYLIESARELGEQPFTIRFSLACPPDTTKLSRIRQSVNNFFLYLAELEQHKIRRMLRKSMAFFGIGIVLLCLSVWVDRWLGDERTVVANVLAEGITIAAWVSVWEAVAILFFKWLPVRRNTRLYRRLASVQLVFRAGSDSEFSKRNPAV